MVAFDFMPVITMQDFLILVGLGFAAAMIYKGRSNKPSATDQRNKDHQYQLGRCEFQNDTNSCTALGTTYGNDSIIFTRMV